ncbi:LOW QUALITY PROTEIN: hypothetical protein TorRG33x02_271570 [Trema orientale]|uniref:Uncharacterized protein n=1 Tax=Trema orientale TaxID=63057 RepID=A0A2P5CVL2_TREOI|nr:LOW QUALITY PROTEIN: hypothetical protein TorRG33x02_271570 [Trema orientale]
MEPNRFNNLIEWISRHENEIMGLSGSCCFRVNPHVERYATNTLRGWAAFHQVIINAIWVTPKG